VVFIYNGAKAKCQKRKKQPAFLAYWYLFVKNKYKFKID
jgi:hypothetical protein